MASVMANMKLVLMVCFAWCALFSPTALATLNSVLNLNSTFPYLIDRQRDSVIEPRDYMDFENLYAPNSSYKLKQTAQGRNYHLIKAFDFANYYQSDYWHYSNEQDLLQSAQPVANERRCSQQLDWLETQLNRSHEVLFRAGEQHVNLMAFIDSLGHPESATYFGHGYWLGSYHECLRTSLDRRKFELEDCIPNNAGSANCNETHKAEPTEESLIKFRYCIGKAHDKDWPTPEQDNYVPRISYKVGLCLPEACETLTFKSRASQLERLMRINMPDYMKQRINLHDMYCLPDNRSPIRKLPTSGRIFLGITGAWLVILLISTFIYSCYKRHQRDVREILLGATVGQQLSPNATTKNQQFVLDTKRTFDLTKQLVIPNTQLATSEQNQINSAKLMLQIQTSMVNSVNKERTASCPVIGQRPADQSATRSACQVQTKTKSASESNISTSSSYTSSTISNWLSDSPSAIKILQALSIKETMREFRQPPKLLEAPDARKKLRVNLNALDSIKCLCCILVIFGHIIFIHMQHLSNIIHTIELSYEIYPRALIAFFNFVDTFFIISGMLTAYFIFKRFNKKTFSNPVIWIYISVLRLLRLSPVYILVLWFIKTVSVYMTDGPIWDYGTDKNSIKGLCINDHWWKSILYFGNVGTMQPLCILPAWSIIVDAQYSLVVPLILFLIFKHKRLGYFILLLATIISTTKMSLQLASQTAVKASDMAKIRLHVYPLISRFAAEFYNTAWNRIGPVAIGIFGGHMLYLYEIGRIKQWPAFMRGAYFKVVLFLHLLIFMLPVIGRFTDDPEQSLETDMTIFIMSNATIKPIWSLINTILLLRLITDLRSHSVFARLMSHNIWHCLGKLCFTSYLIHYEIILTLLKSRPDGLIDPNWWNAMREFSAVFLISTVISYFIYILYEAPVNRLIMLAFAHRSDAIKSGEAKQDQLNGASCGAMQPSPGGVTGTTKLMSPSTDGLQQQSEHLLKSQSHRAISSDEFQFATISLDDKNDLHRIANNSVIDRGRHTGVKYTQTLTTDTKQDH